MTDRIPPGSNDPRGLEEAQRTRANKVGCLLGLFFLGTVAAMFAWKL